MIPSMAQLPPKVHRGIQPQTLCSWRRTSTRATCCNCPVHCDSVLFTTTKTANTTLNDDECDSNRAGTTNVCFWKFCHPCGDQTYLNRQKGSIPTRQYSSGCASMLASRHHSQLSWRAQQQQQQQQQQRSILVPSLVSEFTDRRHDWIQYTPIRTKVFVSRHNNSVVTAQEIKQYCYQHDIRNTRETMSHVIIRECPFCEKPTNDMASNLYKLYVSIGSGAFFCHRCGVKGSWYDFKSRLGGFSVLGPFANTDTHTNGPTLLQPYSMYNGPHQQQDWSISSNTPQSMGRSPSTSRNNPYSQTMHNNVISGQRPCLPMPSQRVVAAYITDLLDNPTTSNALRYLLDERKIHTKTLRKYGVGRGYFEFPSDEPGAPNAYVQKECVTFPWIMRASEVQEQESLRGAIYEWIDEEQHQTHTVVRQHNNNNNNNKDSITNQDSGNKNTTGEELGNDNIATRLGPWIFRRIKARAVENKACQKLDPSGGGWGLFGWHTIPSDATEIVITEGEYDAMAVYQATSRPAISLPNGCRSLPIEVLPMLERFKTIYLWMDNDGPGREGAEQFAKKIGLDRCLLVQPPPDGPKDANDALRENCDLNEILEAATAVPHEKILQFPELRECVLHEIVHPEKYAGVCVPSLPTFTNIIKGFRRGEVTVLSGPTGSGKTTFLGQLSLDFAEQGINTLWGSFEIKNTRLIHKLLQQFSRKALPMGDKNATHALEALADRFESLPLYFMKFHGGSDVDDVIDAMDYSTYVHDVEHIIVDNMQFMISSLPTRGGVVVGGGGSSPFNKFDVQDMAIEKFRKFATDKNVHVTLVVHPRKEDEGAKLGLSSIYGSAKATQEADNVLILQHDKNRKYIEVKKNRFDGTLGICHLFFDSKSARYTDRQMAIPETNPKPQRKNVIPPKTATPISSLPPFPISSLNENNPAGTEKAVPSPWDDIEE